MPLQRPTEQQPTSKIKPKHRTSHDTHTSAYRSPAFQSSSNISALPLDVKTILYLQRTIGNHAVNRLLSQQATHTHEANHLKHSPSHQSETIIQRTLVRNPNIDASDMDALIKVLIANPILRDMWYWICHHPGIALNWQRGTGMSRINAPLPNGFATPGPIQNAVISFTLNPLMGDTQQRRSEAAVLETMSHELNLHLLPWARVMMVKEFRAISANQIDKDTYGEEQFERVLEVLSDAGDLETEIPADATNKTLHTFTGKDYGNHSDIGLWLRHLRTLKGLAEQETDETTQAKIISTGIEKMVLPMIVTGNPDHTIDRGEKTEKAFDEFLFDLWTTYQPKILRISSKELEFFDQNVNRIWTRIEEYKAKAKEIRKISPATSALYTNPEFHKTETMMEQ